MRYASNVLSAILNFVQESTPKQSNTDEEEKCETTGKEIANPEDYIKHPLKNK